MIGFREIKQIASAVVRAILPEVRTHLVGQVVSYDPETNTAEIQPVVRTVRMRDPNNPTTATLPVLADVPVTLPGSGSLWLAFGPVVGTYGTLHVYDREIETWLSSGGIVDPGVIRMHDLSDCSFEPSLVHLVEEEEAGKIVEPIETDRIALRTRSNVTAIAVLDDETIEVKNENATVSVDVDGNVILNTAGEVTLTADGNVTTDAAETVLQAGGDYAVQFTEMKSAFDDLKNELNSLVTAYNAHIHVTTATIGLGPAVGVIAPTTSTGTPPVATMDAAKVADVRLP